MAICNGAERRPRRQQSRAHLALAGVKTSPVVTGALGEIDEVRKVAPVGRGRWARMLEVQEGERPKLADVPSALLQQFAPDGRFQTFTRLAATSGHDVARAVGLAHHNDSRASEHHGSNRRNQDVRHGHGGGVTPRSQPSLRPLHLMVEERLVGGEH